MSALRALPITRTPSPFERRMADRDDAAYRLVSDIVTAAGLSPRRDAELHQVGAERIRRVLDQLELTCVSAVALEREERAADQHVRGACSWCSRSTVRMGVCRGFRAIRHSIDRLHHAYRRHARRLERAS